MLFIEIKVVPLSGRIECVLDKSGFFKCYVKAAPEKGKANREVIDFLAKKLNIPRNVIDIVAGATGRKKLLKICRDMTYDQFLQNLFPEMQKKLW